MCSFYLNGLAKGSAQCKSNYVGTRQLRAFHVIGDRSTTIAGSESEDQKNLAIYMNKLSDNLYTGQLVPGSLVGTNDFKSTKAERKHSLYIMGCGDSSFKPSQGTGAHIKPRDTTQIMASNTRTSKVSRTLRMLMNTSAEDTHNTQRTQRGKDAIHKRQGTRTR